MIFLQLGKLQWQNQIGKTTMVQSETSNMEQGLFCKKEEKEKIKNHLSKGQEATKYLQAIDDMI